MLVGTASSSAPARTEAWLRSGVEDLEGDQEAERAGRRAHEAACRVRARRRSARPRGRRSARRRSGTGTYSPKGTRCTFSKTPTMCPSRTPGHDLVAEGRGRRRLGDPDQQRGARARGPAGSSSRRLRASRPAAGRGRRRPRATARARARADRTVTPSRRELRVVDRRGRRPAPCSAPLAAALDERDPQRPDGGRRRGPRRRRRPAATQPGADHDGPDAPTGAGGPAPPGPEPGDERWPRRRRRPTRPR